MSAGTAARRKPPKLYVDPSLVPDVESIDISVDEPVETMYQDSRRRLLVNALYSDWTGPGKNRPWMALADVGVFATVNTPPWVPDVLVSVDVAKASDPKAQGNTIVFRLGRRQGAGHCRGIGISNRRGAKTQPSWPPTRR